MRTPGPEDATEGFGEMKREQTMTSSVVPFPAHIAPAVVDEDTASIIAVLQDQLALAREGREIAQALITAPGEDAGILLTNFPPRGWLDHESLKPEKTKADVAAMFANVDQKKAGSLIVHGWVMAEDLVKIGAR